MSHFHKPRTFALSVGFVALSIVYSAQLTAFGLSQDQYPASQAASMYSPLPMPKVRALSRSASSANFRQSAPVKKTSIRAVRKVTKAQKPSLRHTRSSSSSAE